MAIQQTPGLENSVAQALDYERVAGVLDHLVETWPKQPSLGELSALCGLSESHLQRMYSRWAGLSPKKFMKFLTLQRAKAALENDASVLDASLASGLSGPGRLHDLFVTTGECKNRGKGLALSYGWHDSPFGDCLLVRTDRGVCGMAFAEPGDREATRESLLAGWENAEKRHVPERTGPWAERVFPTDSRAAAAGPVPLLLRGTPFQIKVWEALLRIPEGDMTCYGKLADDLGYGRSASRAVGSAVGANSIAYLIPCHRVIRGNGALGGYRWGLRRKLAMLGWEGARHPVAH